MRAAGAWNPAQELACRNVNPIIPVWPGARRSRAPVAPHIEKNGNDEGQAAGVDYGCPAARRLRAAAGRADGRGDARPLQALRGLPAGPGDLHGLWQADDERPGASRQHAVGRHGGGRHGAGRRIGRGHRRRNRCRHRCGQRRRSAARWSPAGPANNAQGSLQQRYDVAYSQCMYAKGNQVPGFAAPGAPPPPPPPPNYAAPSSPPPPPPPPPS